MDSRPRRLFDESVATAKAYARVERRGQLKRDRVRAFDSRGLHLFSYEVGRAQALIDAFDELKGVVLDPVGLRGEAFDEVDEAAGLTPSKERDR